MSNEPPRIVFAGTPEFAAKILQTLIHAKTYQIVGIYTQPDRPSGRGRKITSSPVKNLAIEHHIPVYQPPSLREIEAQQELFQLAPDLLIVVGYGLILPQAILDYPRLGCVNVHASLLPRWRGAAPIQRAILAGDKETGITLMRMELALDSGPIISQSACLIKPHDTALSLHNQLTELGARLLMNTLPDIVAGNLSLTLQPMTGVTYAEKITRSEAKLDWNETAAVLERKIRAFNPKPIAYAEVNGIELRIWDALAESLSQELPQQPGEIIKANDGELQIATGNGILNLLKVQLPGKNPVLIKDFLNAYGQTMLQV